MRLYILFATCSLIIACNNSSNDKKTVTDTAKTTVQMPAEPLVSDTLLHAVGTEPFWSLYVIKDKKIIFHPAEGADVEVPFVAPANTDSVTRRFTSANDNTNLELIITKQECSDGMSEKVYPYSVTLSLNAVKYKGCGEE